MKKILSLVCILFLLAMTTAVLAHSDGPYSKNYWRNERTMQERSNYHTFATNTIAELKAHNAHPEKIRMEMRKLHQIYKNQWCGQRNDATSEHHKR